MFVQVSLEEYLLHPELHENDGHRLSNMQSSEFGVNSDKALDDLIANHFPGFKLVRERERAVDDGVKCLMGPRLSPHLRQQLGDFCSSESLFAQS